MGKIHAKRLGPVVRILGAALTLSLGSSCLILDGSFHERQLDSFKFTKADNPGLRMERTGVIDEAAGTIRIDLPNYLDLTSLSPEFDFKGVKVIVNGVEQTSGKTKNDFSIPITYSVLGIDDKTTDYKVMINAVPPSSSKELYNIEIGSTYYNEDADYKPIGQYFRSWSQTATSLVYNFDTRNSSIDLSALYFSFTTDGISVASGGIALPQTQSTNPITPYSPTNILDFTKPVTITVTAEDGSTMDYQANITCNPIMLSFSFTKDHNPSLHRDCIGVIDSIEHTIDVALPNNADVGHLIADFNSSGDSASVGLAAQTSGVSVNDFSSDLEYLLHDNSSKGESIYTVHTTLVPPSSAKSLTQITIGSLYNNSYLSWNTFTNDLDHVFPINSSVTIYHLYVLPVITGVNISVLVDGVPQDLHVYDGSNSTYQSNFVDFTAPVTFVITAEDGSTAQFVAHISKAL